MTSEVDCTGKVRFETMKHAKVALKYRGKRRAAYRCTVCHGYHLGGTLSGGRSAASQKRRRAKLEQLDEAEVV